MFSPWLIFNPTKLKYNVYVNLIVNLAEIFFGFVHFYDVKMIIFKRT